MVSMTPVSQGQYQVSEGVFSYFPSKTTGENIPQSRKQANRKQQPIQGTTNTPTSTDRQATSI